MQILFLTFNRFFSYHRIRQLPLTAAPLPYQITPQTRPSEPVRMPTIKSGLSNAIMLELFHRISKDVTYNLVNGTQKNLLNRNTFISSCSVLSAHEFSFPYFTCAANAISVISWFACAIVRAFSVVTESIGVAVMLFCLTLVYVCKIVNRMH